jgi:3-dehydroquinate synthetase
VGVDLPQGKNLVGAFHQPSMVITDTATLDTLPEKEFRNGMAELFKAALIADPLLFEWLERGDGQATQRWIERALAVKINVVNVDPFEKDVRAALNLGHTVGHGIEAASEYTLSHGEAVAIGLVAEAHMAEAIGLAKNGLAARIEAVLTQLGLPTRFQKLTIPAVRTAMSSDKKKAGGQLRFALPVEPGVAEIGQSVPENVIQETLESVKESA